MTDMSSSFCFLGVRANSGGAGPKEVLSSSAFTIGHFINRQCVSVP